MEKVSEGMNIRNAIKKLLLSASAIIKTHVLGSAKYNSTSCNIVVRPTTAHHLDVFYCSDRNLFVEFGELREGIIVTEKEMIVYAKQSPCVNLRIPLHRKDG